MTPRSDEWYERMTGLMEEHVSKLSADYWESRHVVEEKMRLARVARKQGYGVLVEQFQSFVADQAGTPRPRPGTSDNAEVEEEIHTRLGLWLCSYFLGFPLPHLWEPVRHLQSVLEGYTGSDALYAKLAGDVYRAERKIRARACHEASAWNIAESTRDEVLVLAFSPTLLLPYEDLPIPEPHAKSGSARAAFEVSVSKLARQYLRLQLWLYLSGGNPHLSSGNPLRYAFQIEAAAAALREHLGPEADTAARRETVERRFQLMGGTDETLLYAIPDHMMSKDVWTSCTLGKDDGAVTDRPQKLRESTRRSTWIRSQYLALEREKVYTLLFEGKEAKESDSVRSGIATRRDAIEALLAAAANDPNQTSANGSIQS
ncbi:MAG TPA: hypothetical protein VF092_24375 [Longimicrobium sp.]